MKSKKFLVCALAAAMIVSAVGGTTAFAAEDTTPVAPVEEANQGNSGTGNAVADVDVKVTFNWGYVKSEVTVNDSKAATPATDGKFTTPTVPGDGSWVAYDGKTAITTAVSLAEGVEYILTDDCKAADGTYTFYFVYQNDEVTGEVDVLSDEKTVTNTVTYFAIGEQGKKLAGKQTQKFACEDVWGVALNTDVPKMTIKYKPNKSDFTAVGDIAYPSKTEYEVKAADKTTPAVPEREGLTFKGWATTCTGGVSYAGGDKITITLDEGVMTAPIDLFTVYSNGSPATGDDFNAVPFVAAAVVALGAAAGVMIAKKRTVAE